MVKRYILNSDRYYLEDTGVLTKLITVDRETKEEVIEPIVTSGYPYWDISFHGDWYPISCHILMAMTFIPNPDNLAVVNHKDGNKYNWALENLEWLSQRDNVLHAHRTGLIPHTTELEIVDSICQLIDLGQTNKTISDLLSIPPQTVSDIRCGKRHQQTSKKYKFAEKF